jgi:NADH-quinone oxidoreductase subunit F
MPRNATDAESTWCATRDESEPGTCHDRDILRYNPHCTDRGDGDRRLLHECHRRLQLHSRRIPGRVPVPRFEAALKEAYEAAGLLGKNILGSGVDFDLHTPSSAAGAYICGEETALLDSLEGKTRQAALQTAISRRRLACTAAHDHQQHPKLRLGTHHSAQGRRSGSPIWASPKNSGGTMIFSVSGHVEQARQFRSAAGYPVRRSAGTGRRHAWKGRNSRP